MSASFKNKYPSFSLNGLLIGYRFEDELKGKLLQKSNSRLTEEACLIKMFKYFDIYDKGSVDFNDF
jgi:hypothetical protein